MTRVRVESSIRIAAPPGRVWPLLCDARLPLSAPVWFRLGVPTPETCRLVGEPAGVGSTRQCQTDRGVIRQTITEWDPPHRLGFLAVSDTLGLSRHVAGMTDTFLLDPDPAGTRLTRRTEFETLGRVAAAKACLFRAGVRHVHRHVMRNFKALAEASSADDPGALEEIRR